MKEIFFNVLNSRERHARMEDDRLAERYIRPEYPQWSVSAEAEYEEALLAFKRAREQVRKTLRDSCIAKAEVALEKLATRLESVSVRMRKKQSEFETLTAGVEKHFELEKDLRVLQHEQEIVTAVCEEELNRLSEEYTDACPGALERINIEFCVPDNLTSS